MKMDRLTIIQHIKIIKTYHHRSDDNFSNKIFFSNKAHLTLGGYVNKQNCIIWGSENSQVIEEWLLHPENVLV